MPALGQDPSEGRRLTPEEYWANRQIMSESS